MLRYETPILKEKPKSLQLKSKTSKKYRDILVIIIVTRKKIVWKRTIAYCSILFITVLIRTRPPTLHRISR